MLITIRWFNLKKLDAIRLCLVDRYHEVERLVTLMREQVRSSDIVARYGGEVFVIILPDTGIQLAYEVAERIRRQV